MSTIHRPFVVAVLTATVLMLAIGSLVAQDIQWEKTFGGDGQDAALGVTPTNDGGYLAIGYTTSYKGGAAAWTSGYVVKSDANGGLQWERGIGNHYSTYLYRAFERAEGYSLFGRNRHTTADTRHSPYVAKIDRSGELLWERSYTSSGRSEQFFGEVIGTADGGFAVTMYSASVIYFYKLDSSAGIEWQKVYAGQQPFGLQQTSDGGYIIAGQIVTSGDNDIYLLKTTVDGDSVWSQTIGTSQSDEAYLVRQTEEGYDIAGENDDGLYLMKTDTTGTLVSERTLRLPGQIFKIRHGHSGDLIITGSSAQSGGSIAALCVTWEGDSIWNRVVKVQDDAIGHDIQPTIDGGYIVAGQASFITPPTANGVLLKLSGTSASTNVSSPPTRQLDLSDRATR